MGKDERSDVRGRRPTQCRAGPNISAGPSKASYDNGGWQGKNWSSFQHVVIKRFNLGSQPGRKTNWSDRPLIPTRREQSRLSNGSHQESSITMERQAPTQIVPKAVLPKLRWYWPRLPGARRKWSLAKVKVYNRNYIPPCKREESGRNNSKLHISVLTFPFRPESQIEFLCFVGQMWQRVQRFGGGGAASIVKPGHNEHNAMTAIMPVIIRSQPPTNPNIRRC